MVIAAVLGYLANALQAKLGVDIEAKQRKELQALRNGAGLVTDRAGGVASAIRLPTQDPLIRDVDYVAKCAPDSLNHFGIPHAAVACPLKSAPP